MTRNSALKVRLTYHFQNRGSFELLEFEIQELGLDASFESAFSLLKELNCFNVSMVFLSTTDQRDQIFGNYNLHQIVAGDYGTISQSALIKKLSFPYTNPESKEDGYPGIEDDQLYNQRIREIARTHLNVSSNCFELKISDQQRDKFSLSSVWEEFKNFICIDREKNRVHLITIGKD